MKALENKEAEARKIYEIYWDSYMIGDLETFASILDEDFEMIGTSESEVAHNKAEGIEFYRGQMQEIVGKAEMRNRIVAVKPVKEMVLINETCDIYVLSETEWIFYSKIRISTLFHETESGWKVLQQHGSFPDMRVQEGETLALEKITKENLELRDAIKRRTIELENKNQELAIEAALEKVRTVAMGMKKPEDMLAICRIISEQLQQFGVTQIRNIQTAIIDEEKGIYLCYQYFTAYDKEAVEKTDYLKSPVEHGMVRQMLASENAHFTNRLIGKELEEFREHRKAENHFPDPLLDKTIELSYCFLSIGQGGLGLTLYQPLDAATLDLFKRFHQVFSLSYQRFLDIEKAEARAREVEIDLALERVRAQTMAMHSSEDVGKCIVKMFAELTALGVDEGTRFGIGILNHDNENNQVWTARKAGEEVNMHIGNLDMNAHPLLKSVRKAWKGQVPFHKYVLEGEDLLDYYQMLNNAPDYKIHIAIEKLPEREVQHCFIFEHGFFYAFSSREFPPELIDIIQRFSSQFAQTFRRYLDLVMAEAQTREARIEAALEKVRSRSLAMHKSEELKEVIQVVFDQFIQLKIQVDHAGFILDYINREDMHIWLADRHKGVPSEINIPYFDSPHWNSFREAKAKGETFFANLLPFDLKNKFYQDLFRYIPDLTEEAQQAIFSKPALAISTVLLDNVGLYIKHYSDTPFTAEENAILMRFGKVFEQTYTRFLDLQKAEGQVREAQIEAALERIRARAMAMHHSGELRDVLTVLFNQFDILGIKPVQAQLSLFDLENNRFTFRSTGKGGRGNMGEQIIDMDAMDTWKETIDTWKRSEPKSISRVYFPKDILPQLWALFDDLTKQLPEEEVITQEDFPDGVYVTEGNFNYGYIGFSHNRKATPEEEDIVIRVATEFGRLYQRFLDLQKAEAQAREAQIQLSLERIRAKAMAMQHSDELSDFLTVLFEQFNVLNLNPVNCHLTFLDIENNRNTFRITGKRGTALIATQEIDLDASPLWKKRKEDWKAGHPNDVDVLYVPYENRQEIGEIFKELLSKLPEEDRPLPEDFPDGLYVIDGYCRYGYLGYSASKPPSDEEKEITRRIAHEFGNVYQRFLDLEKAESQAREAQIQLSLERIRAKAMSMQHSDELSDFLTVLFEQFEVLYLNPVFCHLSLLDLENNRITYRMTGRNGARIFSSGKIDLDISSIWNNKIQELKSGRPREVDVMYFPNEIIPEISRHVKDMLGNPPENELPKLDDFPDGQYVVEGYCKYGYLGYSASRAPSDEEKEITRRIANEFGNVYQRFLDLEKAEAQTREAQIETALEKVRSRSLAMHRSEEILDVCAALGEQLTKLGLEFEVVNIGTDIGNKDHDLFLWIYSREGGKIYPSQVRVPYIENPIFTKLIESIDRKEDLFALILSREDKVQYYTHLFDNTEVGRLIPQKRRNFLLKKAQYAASFSLSKHTVIGIVNYEGKLFSDDQNAILRRFAYVFNQSYTRFLDLQKAEAQTREAQIQLSLERVRARTMAMQSSEELAEVSYLLNKQVVDLGIPTRGCAFNIYNENDSKEWFSNLEGTIPAYKTPRENIFLKYYETGQRGESLYIEEFGGDRIKEHYKYLATLSVSGKEGETIEADVSQVPEYQIDHVAYFKYGYLLFITLVPAPEAHEVFKRFAKEFEQTYTRFLDLQKAEAQAREATKQASLDRVRGVIASMRSATDLELITPLIFRELTILGVPFIRCGVFIIKEKQELVEAYLSSPDGNSLGALRLPFKASELTYQTVEAWRKGAVYRQHWSKEDFVQWIKQLMEQDQIQDSSTYQGSAAPPESLDLHFVPFTQGMLYVGAVHPLDEKELELVQALAKAFSIAYARYEDFVKLENAKAEVESAMSELKATQTQLVQQEKLASLGQLTAGIAHEIKNPLNFVNNFSEVSLELIEEALDEITQIEDNEHATESAEILADIKSNLTKIHEHGTRANSIVSSMLQHSRGGSGKMEPTDLNALIKEYVNLSFHGMRAGKNPIDVDIVLDLDQEIKEVPLIKEDFTRVIINLCNNAFDAMRGKKYDPDSYREQSTKYQEVGGNGLDYLPKLRVSTILENGQARISFEDNGPGIPDDIKDKILQPFFTTKKGTEGTGLGLSITNDIIKAHGGELAVSSTEGEGSEFVIHLPLE